MTRRCWAIAALLAGLLAGCVSQPQAQDPPTPDPAVEEIRQARAALGDPAVALAESVIALGDDLDAIRHELPRGRDMLTALAALDTAMEAVRDAADEAERSAAQSAPATAAVARARAAVGRAVAGARDAVTAAEAEQSALVPLAELDAGLDAAVEAWDEPGSQSERRAALAALAAELDAVAGRARALEPHPPQCEGPWERRARWAQLLAERTRELETSATGTGGATYDELRTRYREQPYGEDRVRADAADRGCWREASQVAAARASAPEHVADLEAALNP